MKRLINSARWGIGEGGFACGPVAGPVVAEAEIETENGEVFFFTLAEVEGIPNLMKSTESVFELNLKAELSEDEEILFEESLTDYDGCSYEDFFESRDEIEDFDVYRYLVFIVRAQESEADRFIKETSGKYIEDVDVPASDVEEDLKYGNDLEEEE